MKEHIYFVYMIASKSRVLYIGMTNNLCHRVWEHKSDQIDGFTKTYKCHRLVFFESFDDVAKAIDREKQLKRWNRTKKRWLISLNNPTWKILRASGTHGIKFTPEKQQVPPRAVDWQSQSTDLVGMTELKKMQELKKKINAQTN